MSDDSPKHSRWISWLLVSLPLWLVVSAAVAIWWSFHHAKQDKSSEQLRFSQAISANMLADDLRKITEVIGERHGGSEIAARNLSRMSSMIEGLLGPGNTGYKVNRIKGPADWPLLHVTLDGENPRSPPVWVITSYDSKPGSPGVEKNATGLAATLAVAQALAGDRLESTVHFVFLPHANDPQSPFIESAQKVSELIKSKGLKGFALYVESMGAGARLWLSSRDANVPALKLVDGIGEVHGADVICLEEDLDFSSVLFQSGVSCARIATRNPLTQNEPDDIMPALETLVASSGRLVELVRRCARIQDTRPAP